jgi:hypothetical protein
VKLFINFILALYYRDAIIVSVLDCVTSVFAGLVIFSIIGYMAEVLEQDIKDVATEGNCSSFIDKRINKMLAVLYRNTCICTKGIVGINSIKTPFVCSIPHSRIPVTGFGRMCELYFGIVGDGD